ncbi:MAG: FAD-dependent oxidoreductase, partial [Cyanobacteria bacterium P01_F01_bin.153]
DYMSGEMESYQTNPLYVELLENRRIRFIKSTVVDVNLDARYLSLSEGSTIPYQQLVLAAGSVPAFFAEGAADHTLTFQSKDDADALKQHLMRRLEQATRLISEKERRSLLTVAIVGGGPVGVELALTLGDLLPQWFQGMGGNLEEMRIVLLNRGDILSGDVNSRLRNVATQAAKYRQVPPEIVLGASVTRVRSDAVEFTRNDQPQELVAGTIVWTAGAQVHPLIKSLPVPDHQRTRQGQLLVKSSLQLVGYPDVFAAGDCAVVEENAPPLPATAQVAYQQGEAIAHALLAKAKRQDKLPAAKVGLRGTVMKLGLGTAVANVFDRYEIVGSVAQTIRQVMYLELMPTPLHNIRTTLDWIKDDVFQLHSSPYHDIDYTAGYEVEALLLLGSAVVLSATAVSAAETGLISDGVEFSTLRQDLAGATSKYPTNPVIHALFGHQVKRSRAMEFVQTARSQPVDELVARATTRISQGIALLRANSTPEVLRDYKELLYDCCQNVAKAAGGDLFDGRQVGANEAAVLVTIETALNSGERSPENFAVKVPS